MSESETHVDKTQVKQSKQNTWSTYIGVIVSLIIIGVVVVVVTTLGHHGSRRPATSTAPVSSQSGSLRLQSDVSSVQVGSPVAVTVEEDSGKQTVNVVQATMEYDPSLLRFQSIDESNIFPVAAATQTDSPGQIKFARAISGGSVAGKQSVLTVHFLALHAGSAVLSIDKPQSNLVRTPNTKDILDSISGAHIVIRSKG